MKAVVLLSGGLDSATCLSMALKKGLDCYPLSISYGQVHSRELQAAEAICSHYGIELKRISINLDDIGGSSLYTGNIPKHDVEDIGASIPSTYVPGRNAIFLSIALSYAEVMDAQKVFIGVNALDYSGYPDCRPEFIEAFQAMADKATKTALEGKTITIETPLLNLTKAEIISKGIKLDAPYHLTWSCYSGGKKACGQCDACVLRLKGFEKAGYQDPIRYEEVP